MRDCILLYNNVGLGIGNFEEKILTSKILITPLSLGASYIGNPCEYSHKRYVTEIRVVDLHYATDSWCLPSFKFFWWAPQDFFYFYLFLQKGRFSHSRSSKVTDIGANRKRICDFLLVRNSNFGPILHRFWARARFMCSWTHPYSTLILGVFPLHHIVAVGHQWVHGP